MYSPPSLLITGNMCRGRLLNYVKSLGQINVFSVFASEISTISILDEKLQVHLK